MNSIEQLSFTTSISIADSIIYTHTHTHTHTHIYIYIYIYILYMCVFVNACMGMGVLDCFYLLFIIFISILSLTLVYPCMQEEVLVF